MSKMKKQILARIGIIILCYFVIVFADAVRLNGAKTGTKPLITLKETHLQFEDIYTGLGYSVRYYQNLTDVKTVNYQGESVTAYGLAGEGTEFKLFDIIPVWNYQM